MGLEYFPVEIRTPPACRDGRFSTDRGGSGEAGSSGKVYSGKANSGADKDPVAAEQVAPIEIDPPVAYLYPVSAYPRKEDKDP